VNGIRPITTLLSTPAANSQTAHVFPRASGMNASVAAIAARTPTHAGPGQAANGANSIE
jgi:hypothetical protein